MYDYSKREEVSRYLLWSPHLSIRMTRAHLRYVCSQYKKNNFFDWAIVEKESAKMIGTCGFSRIDAENNSAEIGYVLSSDYWGMGYATEAVARVIAFGFETCGFNRIYARILEGNTASMRVAEKNMLRREATHKNAIIVKDAYKTYHEYAILQSEYFAYRHEM